MPARIDTRRRLTVAILIPCAALAQPPQWPSAEDVARALQAHPLPTPERIDAQPPRAVPRLQSHPPSPDAIDIAAMARGGAALSAQSATTASMPALRIFITLDMPRASLQRLVDQATRSRATLVLRGLKAQSLRETLASVSALIETRRVAWVIDPDAFARYQVTVAPTFVLTLADAPAEAAQPQCGSSSAMPRAFVSVAGDVSLDYALDAISRRSPVAAPSVTAILERLRGS